jgi:drug/metabolite transporter (DMT)-like permease
LENEKGKIVMKNALFLVVIYSFILALSQIFLKLGTNVIGEIRIKGLVDVYRFAIQIIKSPFLLLGVLLMASSFFLWIYILSWFKLGYVFPLTALIYVFVAIMSYFMLAEKLSIHNYLGILLIFLGVFFLLNK